MHRMNILMSAAVAVACSSTTLLAQTQPAVPAAPPAMTQPTPLIPPEAQPQTPATAQPLPRPTMPLQTPTVGQPQAPVAGPSSPAPVGPPPQMPGSAPLQQIPAGTSAPAATGVTVPWSPATFPSAQTAPVAPARVGISDAERGSAVQLLDRIQAVLDKAVDGKSDQVSLDRGLLDEIRAEVTQVKITMQGAKQ